MDPEDSIADIKAQIEDKLNLPVDQQHLFFNEKPLNDDKSLKDYGIKKSSTLILKLGEKMQIFI